MEKLKRVLLQINSEYEFGLEDALNKFKLYMNNILEKNKFINLTTITDENEFILKHYIDSLAAAKLSCFKNAKHVIDIGTGAGFPGIPLAIIFPSIEFVLVDSVKKKLNIIDEICEKIDINNIKTCHIRAEDLGRDKKHREKYDICLSRAVANLEILSEYCIPLIKIEGKFIAYKGPKAEAEIKSSEKAIKILGGEFVGEYKPDFDEFKDMEHKLYIIKKIQHTPDQYPRKAGVPSKEPIQ